MFALRNYARSRLRQEALPWAKTDHSYPILAATDPHRVDLNEVLVKCGYISEEQLSGLAERLRPGEDLVEFLLTTGVVSEHDLCRAMSLQSGLPWSDVDVTQVNREVLRNLPVRVQRDFNVLAFRVSPGRLHVATTRVPEAHVFKTVSRFTRLSIEFQLVTRLNYARIRELL